MIKNKKENARFSCFPIIHGKKGWTRIVEAFVAILLIVIVLILVINVQDNGNQTVAQRIYSEELSILKDIQLTPSLRTEILGATNLPLNWDDFDSNGLTDVENKINEKTPSYLNCVASLCLLDDACIIEEDILSDIYVQQISINADLDTYSPRKLKLFCWLN